MTEKDTTSYYIGCEACRRLEEDKMAGMICSALMAPSATGRLKGLRQARTRDQWGRRQSRRHSRV